MTNKSGLKRCPATGTPFLYRDDKKHRKREIIQARCKLWSCPYCSEVNRHQHYIRILNGCNVLLDREQQLNFTTVTSHERLKSFEACRKVWSSAWGKLRARARRRCDAVSKYDFNFVWVPEMHKDGRLHFHFINTGKFSTRWWKDNSRSCGLGYQCKTEKLDNASQAVNYAIKYVGKSLGTQEYPKKMRRLSYSQGFPAKPTTNVSSGWQVAETKTSLVSLIWQAWLVHNYDTFLDGEKILEIIQ